MSLSERRKILSVAYSVIIAVSTMLIIASMIISSTFTSVSYIEKHFLTSELEAECDAQLTAHYEALEAESGIPSRVFLTVKEDYGVHTSLLRALQNVFGEEDQTLYNKTVVDYFEKLCTEFLNGNNESFDGDEVRNVAERAAEIYSDVLGFHNTSNIVEKVQKTRKACRAITLVFGALLAVSVVMLSILYREKVKAYTYALVGISSGGLAAFSAASMCYLTKTGSKITVYPDIVNAALHSFASRCFLIAAAVSFAVFAASYIAFAAVYVKSHKK